MKKLSELADVSSEYLRYYIDIHTKRRNKAIFVGNSKWNRNQRKIEHAQTILSIRGRIDAIPEPGQFDGNEVREEANVCNPDW